MARAKRFSRPELRKSGVLDRARKDHRWTKRQADEAELWYDRFLEIKYDLHGGRVHVIQKRADLLWHTHILFTEHYRKYCDRVFGRYVDHTPLVHHIKADPKDVAKGRQEYVMRGWALLIIESGTGCH